MPSKDLIRVDVYLNKNEFPDYAEAAVRTGFRHGGVKLYNQRNDRQVPNTKGLAKYLKYGHETCKALDSVQLLKVAAALKEKQAAIDKLKGLGIE